MKFLMTCLISLNLSAQELDPATRLLKKALPDTKARCETCEQKLELNRTCPEFLSELLEDDKQGGMYGLRKSAYKECNKPGTSLDSIFTRLDYDKVDEFERDIKSNLGGRVSPAVLNKLLTCKSAAKIQNKTRTPVDRRIMLGKAAYSLLRIESAEKELFDQMAFADFINSIEPLRGIECSDAILPSMEAKCSQLKNNCFKNKDADRNNFFILSEKAFNSLTNLEKELTSKNLSTEDKDHKSKARDMIKAKFPWIATEGFKKSYAAQKDKFFIQALKKSFAKDRESSLKKLKEFKNTSSCFIDSKAKECEADNFVATLDSAPEIDLNSANKFANDQDHLKWNINMDAQSCLARYGKVNNEATDLANQALIISGATLATAGLGAVAGLAEAGSLIRSGTALANNATLLSRTAFVSQFTVDSYYGVSGANDAFNACSGHDVGKIESSSKAELSCPMTDSKSGVSFNDQESCKLEVIIAIAGGLPVAAGLKKAGEITSDMKLKEKLFNTLKNLTKFEPQMVTDRNVSASLALFGNSPELKALFNSSKPLKIGTLGAGKGVSAEELAQRGHHVTAVEIGGKTETISKATEKGGNITRINGTDASRAPLEKNSFDLFYETHGANAYTDRPDLLTKNILGGLKKDGKYFAFGGGDADSWALNNKVILENGNVVSYLDWIKTIPGIKVESHIIPGKLSEAGELISPPGSYFVITKVKDEVKVPELQNIYREADATEAGRMVPHQTFAVKSSSTPKLKLPATEGPTQHFVSQGLPTDQLKSLASKGKGAEITIPAGPHNIGILDSAKVRLKDGNEVSLAQYLGKIPGLKVTYSAPIEAKRYVETRNKVKIFNGNADEIKTDFRVTEKVQLSDAKIKIIDPKAVENFLQQHGLDLAGLGKPAPIKFDNAGNAIEQVRAPYFFEK